MKIKKEYLTLIVVVIILIFLLGLFYLYNSNFKNVENPSVNQNIVNNQNPQVPTTPQEKTLDFVSASCTVTVNSDIIKFKIQSTGSTIGEGEMTSFLDDTLTDFKDSNGNKLSSISLNAGTTSDDFSSTTADHKISRKITVSTPARSYDQFLTCS